jgi:hypothetical protein
MGNLAIAARLAKGDGQQRIPHGLLKGRAAKFQRQVEDPAVPGEILRQLGRRGLQNRVIVPLGHGAKARAVGIVLLPQDGDQRTRRRHQRQNTDG